MSDVYDADSTCVYLLSDGSRRTYIGYTTNLRRRYRQHACKLKAGAKATKYFDQCLLLAYISGFPDKRIAMSYEWYAKKRYLRCHDTKLTLIKPPHKRLEKFLAPLHVPKFEAIRHLLTVHVPVNHVEVSDHYNVKTLEFKITT